MTKYLNRMKNLVQQILQKNDTTIFSLSYFRNVFFLLFYILAKTSAKFNFYK